ncbi:MAG: DUF1674 domain-containing protein [Alphaproteobacteria bacterium]|nr:DUF1674 domain-containing protein [Alphaproteobacteria bacterium]
MANLFDRLKKDRVTPPREAAVPPEAEVRGKDPRRLAEEKADRAGEKWRRAAEARGEIVKEIGGPKGLEPTRYGDWEKAGRCIDF